MNSEELMDKIISLNADYIEKGECDSDCFAEFINDEYISCQFNDKGKLVKRRIKIADIISCNAV